MRIDIQAHDFSLTDTLRSHAERRLRFALICCDEHIQRVAMRLSDIGSSMNKPVKLTASRSQTATLTTNKVIRNTYYVAVHDPVVQRTNCRGFDGAERAPSGPATHARRLFRPAVPDHEVP